MSSLLKIFLLTLGTIITICSFFFEESDSFSPTKESKENIYKTTHFTKLTNSVRNVYMILIIIFISLAFLL